MASTSVSLQERSQFMGGDRLYALTRLIASLLLVGSSFLSRDIPIWPPFGSTDPIPLLMWSYVSLAAIGVVLLLFRLPVIGRILLLIDLVLLSLMTAFNNFPFDLFYALFFIPLIAVSIQFPRRQALMIGAIAAAGYGAASFVRYFRSDTLSIMQDPMAQFSLALQITILGLVPWLANGLNENSNAESRKIIEIAEQKRSQALNDAQAYRDRMRSLYEVAYQLSTKLDFQAIMETTLNECCKIVPVRSATILLASEPGTLRVIAGVGLTQDERQVQVRLGEGAISKALYDKDPFLIDNMKVEPIFADLPSIYNRTMAIAIPLRSGKSNYGALVMASDETKGYRDEDIEMLSALTSYAVIVLQNAELVYNLRNEQVKLLSKEEDVRKQLARDLHDGPAQSVAAMTMNVEFIKRMTERDPAQAAAELDKLSKLARRTTQEIRTLLFELRPLALETQGLKETLRQYVDRDLFQNGQTKIDLDADDLTVQLDIKTQGALFNIIQESVNNALKHAQAKHILIRVKQIGSTIEVLIEDDGKGFDMAKMQQSYANRGSFGLLNIDERAKLVNGSATITSEPGKGTRIKVIVPFV
ncbi:MAG: histidine kinase [Roseiflexaceae bacterium]